MPANPIQINVEAPYELNREPEYREAVRQYLVADAPPVRITAKQADAEQAERVARATNTAPVDPAPMRKTVQGIPVVAFAIGECSGMQMRDKPRTSLRRLWRALVG